MHFTCQAYEKICAWLNYYENGVFPFERFNQLPGEVKRRSQSNVKKENFKSKMWEARADNQIITADNIHLILDFVVCVCVWQVDVAHIVDTHCYLSKFIHNIDLWA